MFRTLAIMLAALVGLTTPLSAQTKEKIKFGYLADPSHEAVLWALRNGKVKSDTIEVETTALAIPALIQATAAKTYDVIQTAALAVPRARARGLDLQIIGTGLRYHESGQGAGIWVKKDSPIKTAADLKGKQIAVYSIGSAGITLVRIALASSHGMNVALQGGDVTLVEMPAPAMPAALASGKVDAATLIHAQAWAAEKSGEFRSVAQTAQDNFDKFKLRMVSAVLAGYGEKLSAKPEVYKEFLRVLKASVDYAVANPDEVFPEVGKATQTDPEFFKVWFTRFSSFPVLLSDQDVTAIDLLWEESRKLNILQEKTTAAETLWSAAPRSAK